MYDIIQAIIDHHWVTTSQGDQQYVYMICGAFIVVTMALTFDFIIRLFRHIWRGKS